MALKNPHHEGIAVDLIYRYDPHLPLQIDTATDAESAMRILCDGNRRLTSVVAQMPRATLGGESVGEVVVPICPVSLGLPLWAGAISTQQPYALVLGCSDARVPVEPIFDQSFNDLFVVRIADNVLGTECLGSVDYAVRHFADSLKLVVVLGHTGCGAVSAAVETYLSPKDYAAIAFTHALRSLVDRIMIAVRGRCRSARLRPKRSTPPALQGRPEGGGRLLECRHHILRPAPRGRRIWKRLDARRLRHLRPGHAVRHRDSNATSDRPEFRQCSTARGTDRTGSKICSGGRRQRRVGQSH